MFQNSTTPRSAPIGWGAGCFFLLSLAVAGAQAQSIEVPNGSFESPTPPQGYLATPQIDLWSKTPQPDGVPLPPGIFWEQLSGVFPNTPAGSDDHIDNVTGSQAAYLFAIPGVGISQSLDATYVAGKAYSFSLGALGGGGIAEGSSLLVGLFYLDAGNSLSPVSVTPITYEAAKFPNATHFQDVESLSPEVGASDPWAGKKIVIGLFSTFGLGQGYWDVDNVRLSAVPEPATLALVGLGMGGMAWARARRSRRP